MACRAMNKDKTNTCTCLTNGCVLDRLSAREREVLTLVAEGHTSREIARIAGVKPSSVYTYRSRIMAMLDTANVAVLVRIAIRHKLIKP
jgi:DNA-binding CsgD family transcriptional regulator